MAINRANGGVTGVNNKTSGGGNSITRITASTTFEVQPQTTEVDVLVVAGGGGGGNTSGEQGGGGGAGGFRNLTNQAVAPGSKISVTVGAGGSAATAGSDSVFSNPINSLTADGGGLGGSGGNPAPGPKYDYKINLICSLLYFVSAFQENMNKKYGELMRLRHML